jgi:hypothetical protein
MSSLYTQKQVCGFHRTKPALHVNIFTAKDRVRSTELCLTNKRYLFLFSVPHMFMSFLVVTEFRV